MTTDEAKSLLREMSATWRQGLDEAQTVVWVKTLGGYRADDARAALSDLRTSSDWMPTHSAFVAATQAASRRRALRDSAETTLAIGAGLPSPDEITRAKAHLADMRAHLRRKASA